MISIQSIETKNPLYQMERELRNKILLRPIGVPDHAWEMHDQKAWHFVAVESDAVVGCVVLNPLNPEKTKTQLMQMAVKTNQQGKGIGKLLVRELLSFCNANGIKEVVCHARDNAVPFYLSLGFETYDEPFVEVGIQHSHMRINLDNEQDTMNIENTSYAEAAMLIRKPIAEVFEAFIDPEITTKFWFSKSSGKLEEGNSIDWVWEMYGNHAVTVKVLSILANEAIVIQWGEDEKAIAEWEFQDIGESKTFVTITYNGIQGKQEEMCAQIRDVTEGFTLVLAGLKAYLEHNIQLNLVDDRFPKELREE